ncbi:hypothetical protein PMAYCL1PPCAC_09464, partial [Pristionchus mayeri]
MTEFGFIFYGFRFMNEKTLFGVTTDLIFIALFYQTFVLLAMHYVYRYVLICNPPWLRWISQENPWRNWTIIAVMSDCIYVGVIFQEAYNIDLLGPNRPGFLGIVY